MKMTMRLVPCVAVAALTPLAAEAAPTGELWESTVEMVMAGRGSFAMPAQTTCRPRGEAAWQEPPAPAQGECQMTDVVRGPNSMTWKMKCTDPPATGKGSIEFDGAGSYSGTIEASMPQGDMTMKLSGKRVGDCDYAAAAQAMEQRLAETERASAELQAAQADALAEVCTQSAARGLAYVFIGDTAACKGPEHKKLLCAATATPDGYEGAASGTMGVDLAQVASFCGKTSEAMRSEACGGALAAGTFPFVLEHCPEMKGELCAGALDKKDFLIVAEHCPEQAQPLAQEHCAGRRYTSEIEEEYRGFCSTYAMQGEPTDTPEQAEAPPEKVGMKKKLKGMFGR